MSDPYCRARDDAQENQLEPLVHATNPDIPKAFRTVPALSSLPNIPNDFCHHASYYESVKRRIISKFSVPRSQEVLPH
jgi:hypothetical protein